MQIKLTEIKFYRELYYQEQTRKSEIDNSIGFPSTLLTIVIGGGLYLLKNSYINNTNQYFVYPNMFLLLFWSLFIITICLSIFFLMKIYTNNLMRYKYLPSPVAFSKRETELYDHYLEFFKSLPTLNPEEDALKASKSKFEEDLFAYYIEFASKNQWINDIRILDLYKARRFLILSIIFMGIFGILAIIN